MYSAPLVCLLIIFSMSAATILTVPVLNLQWLNESCLGSERGLLSTGPRLSLTASNGTDECSSAEVWIEYDSSLPDLNYYLGNCFIITNIRYEYEMPEHR